MIQCASQQLGLLLCSTLLMLLSAAFVLHRSTTLKEAIFAVARQPPAALTEAIKPGGRRAAPLYGHVHMAKTAGSYLNGALALNYERVCGHKGYSYDAVQANRRFWGNPAPNDTLGQSFPGYSRLRVPFEVMDEIGYEDCDFVSQERDWGWWKRFASWNVSVELHLPCRDPIDHLLSQCNFLGVTFNCQGDLVPEIRQCLVNPNRFHRSLNGSEDFPNFKMKCFRNELTSKYVKYMGTKLQRKRFQSTFKPIPSNLPRNRSKECLWGNHSAKLTVEKYMNELEYYKFCNECLGSSHDLLVDWKKMASSVCCKDARDNLCFDIVETGMKLPSNY